jgi:putative DNA primase/helicase
MKPMLQDALEKAKRGWPVFPLHNITKNGCSCGDQDCPAPGKHPRIKDWPRMASCDPSIIKEWWIRWPLANIAIASGSISGLVVLDVDKKSGGLESFNLLEQRFGPLPDGPRVKTGGGGRHLYFLHPGTHVPSRSNALNGSPGIDCKADGGYVVAPPSLHTSGKRYLWLNGKTPSALPLPMMPKWLLEQLQKKSATQGALNTPKVSQLIPAGKRNSELTSLAGTMRKRGMTQDAIEAALIKENQMRCRPPLDVSEVLAIAKSVARYAVGTGTNLPKGNAVTISDLLNVAGFEQLQTGAEMDQVEKVLRELAAEIQGVDNLRRAAVRDAAIEQLKKIGFRSAGRMVDSALRLNSSDKDGKQGHALFFSEPELWPNPVEGRILLRDIVRFVRRFLVLPKWAATFIALWIVHTYALDAADVSPYLVCSSPEKRCGKTLLLQILSKLVWRPITTANISPAAIFRIIEQSHPTLLIDEADTFVKGNDELRGVLNSGHGRGTAYVVRTVGEEHEPRTFSTWCAKAIAAIGRVPETIEDRSIGVRMIRKTSSEKVERYRPKTLNAEIQTLQQQGARWVRDNLETLKNADPNIPDILNDRAQDNWRPLLAIGDAAGGLWPDQARKAAIALSGPRAADDLSAGVQLLTDIKQIFTDYEKDHLSSADIVAVLIVMEERPWPEWRHGNPLTPSGLARLLAKFDIHPKQIWTDDEDGRGGGRNIRGYYLPDFQDAFRRYLPAYDPLEPLEANNDGA